MSPTASSSAAYTVLVFSHDPAVREQVRGALGPRPAPDLGRVGYVEAASGEEVVAEVDAGGIDLAILDGEAQPTGGFGVARTIRQECAVQPLLCVLARRRDDRWLATWSQVDATIMYPLDVVTAAETVAGLLRQVAGAATR
jgi:DNA-binding response OmpR family regulator